MDTVFDRNSYLNVINVPNVDITILDKEQLRPLVAKNDVVSFLEDLSKEKYVEEVSEFVGYLDDEDIFWRLSPIKMALHLGCYDLIPALVKNGHQIESFSSFTGGVEDSRYYWVKKENHELSPFQPPYSRTETVTIGEMLLLIKDIPEHIFNLLLNTITRSACIDSVVIAISYYYDGIDPERLYKIFNSENCMIARDIIIDDRSLGFLNVSRTTLMNIFKAVLTAHLIHVKNLASKGDVEAMRHKIIELRSKVGTYSAVTFTDATKTKNIMVRKFGCLLKARQEMVKIVKDYPQVVKLVGTEMLMDLAQIIGLFDEVQSKIEPVNKTFSEKAIMENIALVDKYRRSILSLVEEYEIGMDDILKDLFLIKDSFISSSTNDIITNLYAYIYAICEFKETTNRSSLCKLTYQNIRLIRLLLWELQKKIIFDDIPVIQIDNERHLNSIIAMFEHIDMFEGDTLKSKRVTKEFAKVVDALFCINDEGLIECLLDKGFINGKAVDYAVNSAIEAKAYKYVPLLLAYKDLE